MRHLSLLLIVSFSLFLISCEQESNHQSSAAPTSSEVTPSMRNTIDEFNSQDGHARPGESFIPSPISSPSSRVIDRNLLGNRRVAETHSLKIETLHDELSAQYDRDFQKCLELECEILSSNLNSRHSAYIGARILPENLGTYLDFVSKGDGELKSHTVSTQDKTLNYIDTEARIKNNEELRNRLVKLLNSADTVDNVIKIETELARVEQNLDAAKGSLRHLQTITAKATVQINYSVPYQDVRIRYDDLKNSFALGWQNFIKNISNVIVFIGVTLPWLPIIFLGMWLSISALRFAIRKKNYAFITKLRKSKTKEDVNKCE